MRNATERDELFLARNLDNTARDIHFAFPFGLKEEKNYPFPVEHEILRVFFITPLSFCDP